MSTLVTGIAELTTHDPELGALHDAALVVEDGSVAWVGRAADAPEADQRVDVGGRAVIPGFVDSHSHLVFAGDRAFVKDAAGTWHDTAAAASSPSTDVRTAFGALIHAAAVSRRGATYTFRVPARAALALVGVAVARRKPRTVAEEVSPPA